MNLLTFDGAPVKHSRQTGLALENEEFYEGSYTWREVNILRKR